MHGDAILTPLSLFAHHSRLEARQHHEHCSVLGPKYGERYVVYVTSIIKYLVQLSATPNVSNLAPQSEHVHNNTSFIQKTALLGLSSP
jgi:hypothetical protein